MKQYTYSPPKFKLSTKLVSVMDENGNEVCHFKRTYKNLLTKLADYLFSIDWYVQYDVHSVDGEMVYQCKKTTKWVGKPEYQVMNCKTNEVFHISYKSWQVLVPELTVNTNTGKYVVKMELMDWAKLYNQGKEVARWKMKATEWFKTYLEIEEDCPIQDPEFFVCLFQSVFYVGE